jgi:arylsulfatase A
MPKILLLLALAISASAQLPKPNIILFMADDMGIGDTSAFQDFTGNADEVQIHTPEMERLAALGTRFTDAHTPSSRCSPTRYGLLTGRYPWRNRLKHWVLFGSQGDPMIEADRPTIASMLRDQDYATAMVGKWHVGLRYTRSDGKPAAGWGDADLSKPLHTSPVDHGFDYARFTSRSHGTSGPAADVKPKKKKAPAKNTRGPGHIHNRDIVGYSGKDKALVTDGPHAYRLKKLGSRHSDHAMQWLDKHLANSATRPFFLYYPSNSNHGPYTPDSAIGGKPVAGASRTKSGKPMDARHDYVYENDVALGRLVDWLAATPDPRRPGHKLLANTIVIFTSDNGAEKNSDVASGPFRSNKGSVFEGGHRVPFIVSWPAGKIQAGATNSATIGLVDLYATFAEIATSPLPNLRAGEKGAEDSISVLAAFRGQALPNRSPLMFHDHKEAKGDHAVSAIRQDEWKLFFDASLLRAGSASPTALYNLATDQREQTNLIASPEHKPVVKRLTELALLHRNAGGHRIAEFAPAARQTWQPGDPMLPGMSIDGDVSAPVRNGGALEIRFGSDVLIESVTLKAGPKGTCGGFYRVGEAAPLAIYTIDGDIDANDQSGILSDIGVLPAGDSLRLDSSPHFGSETPGNWQFRAITFRVLK